MTEPELRHIGDLLGSNVVLLPIRKGGKAPVIKGWPGVRLEDTKTARYRAQLLKAVSVAVLLGEASSGICSIDFDDDDALHAFLESNSALKHTLRTRGQRGGNIWIRVAGERPATSELSRNGKHLGEWRADGSITIIAGQHKYGGHYQYIVDHPPIELEFRDICWPEASGSPPHSSVRSVISTESVVSTVLYHKAPTLFSERIALENTATQELQEDKTLQKLYRRFIEKRFKPQQGRRNSDLVEMVTFLFHAVDPKLVLGLADYFYRRNSSVFTDGLDQHRREAEAHLHAVEATWWATLTPEERAFLDPLPSGYQSAFRITRDLASQNLPDSAVGLFFMSESELGTRLGILPTQAGRILRGLSAQGWFEVVEKGEQWRVLASAGAKRPAKATLWSWQKGLPTGF